MRFKLFASLAIATTALLFQVAPSFAQIDSTIGDQRKRREIQGQQPRQHQYPQIIQPVQQPRPQYVPQPQPQPQPQFHQPRERERRFEGRHDGRRWGGGGGVQIIPQYIDRPVYIQPEPQYYQQPRYYQEEPEYRPRRAVRSRQICRTVWAKDDYGRRYKVKRCRARR